MRPKAKHPY